MSATELPAKNVPPDHKNGPDRIRFPENEDDWVTQPWQFVNYQAAPFERAVEADLDVGTVQLCVILRVLDRHIAGICKQDVSG